GGSPGRHRTACTGLLQLRPVRELRAARSGLQEIGSRTPGLPGMPARVGVDKWIFFTTLLLVSVGLAMVFSASAVVSQARYHSPYMDVARQAGWALAGVLSMVVLMRVDYSRYNTPKFIYPALSISTVLL